MIMLTACWIWSEQNAAFFYGERTDIAMLLVRRQACGLKQGQPTALMGVAWRVILRD